MLYILLTAVIVSLLSGIIGCFIIWKRMAFFGDALGHSALLGVAFGFLIGANINLSIIIVCILFAALLVILEEQQLLPADSLLSILSHILLAMGLILSSFLTTEIDLHHFLFKETLLIDQNDFFFIGGVGVFVLALILPNWSALILTTLNENLAKSEGVNVMLMRILLTTVITLVIATAINIVGTLLVTASAIIPAATARYCSNSPSGMALWAVIFGSSASIIGITLAHFNHISVGPIVILCMGILFSIMHIYNLIARPNNIVSR